MASRKRKIRNCHEGKQAFNTLQDAQRAMKGMIRCMEKRGKTVVTYLRAYKCQCGNIITGNPEI